MDAEDRDVIRCYHDYNCINWLCVCLFVCFSFRYKDQIGYVL